jgi:hypothetical protein
MEEKELKHDSLKQVNCSLQRPAQEIMHTYRAESKD